MQVLWRLGFRVGLSPLGGATGEETRRDGMRGEDDSFARSILEWNRVLTFTVWMRGAKRTGLTGDEGDSRTDK